MAKCMKDCGDCKPKMKSPINSPACIRRKWCTSWLAGECNSKKCWFMQQNTIKHRFRQYISKIINLVVEKVEA